jgi:hypothetical protein
MNEDEKVVLYLKAAHRYYQEPEEPEIMTDYEWDMLAKYLDTNYDSIKTPLKKYLVKGDLFTAHHLPWNYVLEDLKTYGKLDK